MLWEKPQNIAKHKSLKRGRKRRKAKNEPNTKA
jgi:hypothetical protein